MIRFVRFLLLGCLLTTSTLAIAGPKSGGSFGGLKGFRSSSGGLSRSAPSNRGNYGSGSNFVFLPSFGWGYGGWGYGGGFGMVGSLMLVGIVCIGTVMVVRSIRRAARRREFGDGGAYGDDETDAPLDRAYVHKVQLGLGRSARGIQSRLEEFARTGDTASEAGLAELLRQTALELMREKDSIRYGWAERSGPFSLTNGETKMNTAAISERSRFEIERVRGAEGEVRHSEAAASVGREALEYLVVTLLVATRSPLQQVGKIEERRDLDAVLSDLCGISSNSLLGMEVIWTPADAEDSLTETDLMTTYPDMRGL